METGISGETCTVGLRIDGIYRRRRLWEHYGMENLLDFMAATYMIYQDKPKEPAFFQIERDRRGK